MIPKYRNMVYILVYHHTYSIANNHVKHENHATKLFNGKLFKSILPFNMRVK